jgi:hypothetical protein
MSGLARRIMNNWGRATLLCATCVLGACNSVGQAIDLATPVVDMAVAPADLDTGPSCGKILTCIVECGLTKPSCDVQCTMGATATEGMKAGALALCAGLHCVGGELGTGLPAILGCLLSSCQSEVSACDGLL